MPGICTTSSLIESCASDSFGTPFLFPEEILAAPAAAADPVKNTCPFGTANLPRPLPRPLPSSRSRPRPLPERPDESPLPVLPAEDEEDVAEGALILLVGFLTAGLRGLNRPA